MGLYERIKEEMRQVIERFKIFDLDEKIMWKLQIPPANTCGFFWNVGPVKGFTSIDEFLPGQ